MEEGKINIRQILSVDFDCIMYPCIQLYNADIVSQENATIAWAMLEEKYGIDAHLSYDANTLFRISRIMNLAILNGADFKAIKDHDEILKDDDVKKWISDRDIFRITNIDHHHDFGYSPDDKERVITHGEYDCTNWALWASHKLPMDKPYTWVKSPNSVLPKPEDCEKINIVPFYKYWDETTKWLIYFDKVFFCLSPQWVPYKYHHLYRTLEKSCGDLNLINKIKHKALQEVENDKHSDGSE